MTPDEGSSPERARPLVLVVEDHPDLNNFLCVALRDDYEILTAADGEEGIRLAREHHPAAIVTDLMMPKLSGGDLVAMVRAEPSLEGVAVLVLTARSDSESKLRLLRMGAGDYLVKPFDLEELRARLRNLVNLRVLELERQTAHDRAESFFESAPDATVIVDGHGTIVQVNRKAAGSFGYETAELVGQRIEILLPEEAAAGHPRLRTRFMDNPHTRTMGSGLELSLRRKDGSLLPVDVSLAPVETPDGTLIIASVRDVTAQRAAQERLRHLALHDALTELPNRMLLIERLNAQLAELSRRSGCVAVLYIDVDRFKQINDEHGHSVGDEVLVQIGRRLQACMRPFDIVGRLGGDEFVVSCGLLQDEREALILAERVADALDPPLLFPDDTQLAVTVSIGVAIARSAGSSASDLVKAADTAMYRAKQRGRHRIEVFDEELGRLAEHRARAERLIRSALTGDRLRLLYQPMVDLAEHRLQAVEALLRIEDPTGRLIGPADFLEVAEDSGHISAIGAWVIEQACRQAKQWQDQGLRFPVWVNVSGHQLSGGGLPAQFFEIVARTGVDPSLIGLEVTETSFMRATPEVLAGLEELKAVGVGLALDDFGTGWSSLTYLKNLPVDAVKIDRTFTEGLGLHKEDTAIVSSVVSLGQVLGRSVVIEGMETVAQLELARELGCDLAQGYLFSVPLPAEEIPTWRAPGLRPVPLPRARAEAAPGITA